MEKTTIKVFTLDPVEQTGTYQVAVPDRQDIYAIVEEIKMPAKSHK